MASKYYTFNGPLKWVKSLKADPEYKRYTVDVYLDEENLARLKDSGVGLQIREDENGKYVRFSRPETKVIKEELVKFGPPKVVMADGSDLPMASNGDPVKIGNGSEGRVSIVVYPAGKFIGHRWERLTIDKLIPYEPDNGTAEAAALSEKYQKNQSSNSDKKRPF